MDKHQNQIKKNINNNSIEPATQTQSISTTSKSDILSSVPEKFEATSSEDDIERSISISVNKFYGSSLGNDDKTAKTLPTNLSTSTSSDMSISDRCHVTSSSNSETSVEGSRYSFNSSSRQMSTTEEIVEDPRPLSDETSIPEVSSTPSSRRGLISSTREPSVSVARSSSRTSRSSNNTSPPVTRSRKRTLNKSKSPSSSINSKLRI